MNTQTRIWTNDDGVRMVRYWSVYRQVWVTQCADTHIPDEELAALPAEDRELITA